MSANGFAYAKTQQQDTVAHQLLRVDGLRR